MLCDTTLNRRQTKLEPRLPLVLAFLSLMYVIISAVSGFDLNLHIFWFAIRASVRI